MLTCIQLYVCNSLILELHVTQTLGSVQRQNYMLPQKRCVNKKGVFDLNKQKTNESFFSKRTVWVGVGTPR